MSKAFYVEVVITDDPERERLPSSSPFDIISHPFRVMVFDQDLDLLSIATVALGSVTEPARLARLFAETRPGFFSAVVLRRSDHSVDRVVCRKIEDPHAPLV